MNFRFVYSNSNVYLCSRKQGEKIRLVSITNIRVFGSLGGCDSRPFFFVYVLLFICLCFRQML